VIRPAWPRRLACALTATALGAGALLFAPAAAGSVTGSATGSLTGSVGSAQRTKADQTPLRVTIATLAPATIPQRGRVRVTGTITNRSQDTWSNLNVYMVTSPNPILSRSALADAARTDADAQVGNRRTAPGSYGKVADLGPGESVSYRLSVPRRDLGISGEPGVYWVGVHVLGEEGSGRDTVADGRARTFMPLMPSPRSAAGQRARTRLALIVPMKAPVRRGPAGRLLNIDRWQHRLSADGRLDRVLRLSSHTRQPFTWAIDPAVLDAAQSVARDNPVLDPGAAGGGRGGSGDATQTPSSQPSSQPSSDPSTDPSTSPSTQTDQNNGGDGSDGDNNAGDDGKATPKPSEDAVSARIWLAEFRRQVRDRSVAALPYADLDVAAVLGRRPGSGLGSLYEQAFGLSATTLTGYAVDRPTKLVAPTGGYLPAAALRRIGSDTPVLLSQAALPDASSSVVAPPGRSPVVLTDAAAGAGGPSPNSQFAALPVRQRLLSDAALHALSSSKDEPLVVTMPQYWNPGDAWASSDFFSGLAQPWLQMIDLTSAVATASTAPRGSTAAPVYPRADRIAQLPAANLVTTREVTATGRQFDRLLTINHSVDDDISRIAMLASSYNTRIHPGLVRSQVAETGAYVRAQMSRVRVEGPAFVMMSGESGPIQVTVVNGLDQTVTVGLKVSTPGSGLQVEKVDPVTLGPGRRTSIRLQASSHDIGVHPVTLVTTDAAGVPLGSSARFSVRTSNVSTVIWVIMAIGGGLLLIAIVVRLYRRIRRRKTTHGPLLPRERTDRPGQELKA
jgi:Family of unknown function (DUF6049)